MVEGSFQHIISGWGLTQACSSKQPSDLGGREPDFTPDLDDAEDFQLSKVENSNHFGQPISDEALDEVIAKRVSYKTRKVTEWVVSVFRVVQLADLLPRFVMEACRQDKTSYPPKTLVMLVAGIQYHLREMECLTSLSWGIKTHVLHAPVAHSTYA